MKAYVVWFCLCVPQAVWAQQMTRMTFDRNQVAINETVRINVFFERGETQPWCGMRIVFGDGEVRDVRAESATQVLEKVYATPGTYSMHIDGHLLIRGFKSLLPCVGELTSPPLVVYEPNSNPQAATPKRPPPAATPPEAPSVNRPPPSPSPAPVAPRAPASSDAEQDLLRQQNELLKAQVEALRQEKEQAERAAAEKRKAESDKREKTVKRTTSPSSAAPAASATPPASAPATVTKPPTADKVPVF